MMWWNYFIGGLIGGIHEDIDLPTSEDPPPSPKCSLCNESIDDEAYVNVSGTADNAHVKCLSKKVDNLDSTAAE